MTELEKLERGIYELTQFIGADSRALRSALTSQTDKANLRRAIDIRADQRSRLRGLLASRPQSNQNTPDDKATRGDYPSSCNCCESIRELLSANAQATGLRNRINNTISTNLGSSSMSTGTRIEDDPTGLGNAISAFLRDSAATLKSGLRDLHILRTIRECRHARSNRGRPDRHRGRRGQRHRTRGWLPSH